MKLSMQASAKSLIAAAILAVASTSAVAAPGPIPDPLVGPGGVIVAAWDPVRNIGTTTYLGITLTDIQLPALTPETGLTLPFAVDLSVFGGQLSNVIYNVTAADFAGDNGGPVDWQGAFTTNQPIVPGQDGNVLNGVADAVSSFVGRVNQACGTADGCDALNLSDPQYPGNENIGGFGRFLNGALPMDTTAALGTPLNFFLMTSDSLFLSDPVFIDQYANSTGAGTWTLNASGQVVYSIAGAPPVGTVPLPAAVWLLLSGMASVGLIGRRKAAAAV